MLLARACTLCAALTRAAARSPRTRAVGRRSLRRFNGCRLWARWCHGTTLRAPRSTPGAMVPECSCSPTPGEGLVHDASVQGSAAHLQFARDPVHRDFVGIDAEVHQRLGAILVAHENRRQLLTRAEHQVRLHAVVPGGDRLESGAATIAVVHVVRARGNGLDEPLLERRFGTGWVRSCINKSHDVHDLRARWIRVALGCLVVEVVGPAVGDDGEVGRHPRCPRLQEQVTAFRAEGKALHIPRPESDEALARLELKIDLVADVAA